MADITFCRTRYSYDSYTDFFHLVKLAGFPIIYVDDLDVSRPGVYIVAPMNGEWRPHVDNQADRQRNAHLILWNIERPSGSEGSVGQYGQSNRELIYRRYVDEVWVSDYRLALETSLRFVVLGSHPGLGEPSTDKEFSFCHMSYEVPRRQAIYYDGFDMDEVGPNCWPPQRDKVLQQSKFALNVHQDNHPFQEPLRFALFAAYGLPILSETIYDARPWNNDTMAFHHYDGLASAMKQALADDYAPWQAMGTRAREMMTVEYEFGKVVREAVEQSVGDWR